MNLRPTRTSFNFLCFIVFSFILNLSCNKDNELFEEAVLSNNAIPVNEQEDSSALDQTENQEDGTMQPEDGVVQEELESRTTIFPIIHDAYLQNGKGYDQPIVRLEENRRTSYLMFDLSQIDSIGGQITSANLVFLIDTDDGNGIIEVFKGASNDWTENDLSETSAPEIDVQLGTIEQEYRINTEVSIALNASELVSGLFTIILDHKEGDDLAFASKENTEKEGGKLVVTYDAPITSNEILIDDPQINEDLEGETTEGETTGEETTGEETTEVETAEEETTEEETTEEETTEEETTEEEPPAPTGQTNTPPKAVAKATPTSGEVPLEVAFKGSDSSDDKAITTYAWDFEDGANASTADPVHTFTEAGTYNVKLTTTDAEGLNSTATVKITVNAKSNQAPVAKASAEPLSGTAPLDVSFTGSNSTDDNSVASYSWDFKDGSSSNNADPTHTFTDPGTYIVELTVQDGDGLSDKDTVTISVNSPQNEAPNAVATASPLNGNVPLQVDFTGSNSSDDNGIASYNWNLPGTSSSDQNTTHTFNNPGVYDVTLTVTDDAGLQDTATLTITVTQESVGQIPCNVGGGKADDTGEKVWCWSDISLPNYSGSKGVSFSNGELVIDSECYEKQVTKSGNQLKFRVNPTNPNVGSWCSRDFNMRAEIRTAPWNVKNPTGTEEWYGWSYTFGNDYEIDSNNQWLFWQVHHGVVGESPQTELMVIKDGQFNGHSAGEIYVVNNTTSTTYNPTGITPRAGQKLDIVVHVVWGNGSSGLLQVWINGQSVYDKQVATIYSSSPWGGNAKWGIYKWPWAEQSGVQASQQQGITHLETFMGNLRIITRRPGDADYLKDSYSTVAPN